MAKTDEKRTLLIVHKIRTYNKSGRGGEGKNTV
jgi:hypothetical protein